MGRTIWVAHNSAENRAAVVRLLQDGTDDEVIDMNPESLKAHLEAVVSGSEAAPDTIVIGKSEKPAPNDPTMSVRDIIGLVSGSALRNPHIVLMTDNLTEQFKSYPYSHLTILKSRPGDVIAGELKALVDGGSIAMWNA